MKIRFAIVGLGHIGRRHAALVAAHPEAELAAVCDPRSRDDLDWPAELGSGVPLFEGLQGMLAATEFDVACICTPNGLHALQAIRCLRAGRHVVVEKPLALSVTDCDAIIDAARRFDRKVFGVMQNRYSPASAWLKSVIEGGGLGEILQVHLDCFWNRDDRYYRTGDGGSHGWHGDGELDGGVLFTQFAHFVDLLCWLFGDVEVRSARFANQMHAGTHAFPDTGMVHFDLPGGGLGSLNFSTVIWDRNFESTLTVIAARGTIKLGGQYMSEVRYCHAASIPAPAAAPPPAANNYGPYQGSAANHHFVIDNVVETLNGRARVATTAAEGRSVVRVIEAIYATSEPD